jgi:hypothetical protein
LIKIDKERKKMIKNIAKMAMMLVLAMILTAGAGVAQTKGGSLAPVGLYTGLETNDGTFEPASATHYGNTFVLNSFGEWESYHLTVSLDYSMNTFVPNSWIARGGNWSLVVIRDNQYAGTLYGRVISGEVSLVADQRSKWRLRRFEFQANTNQFAGDRRAGNLRR